MKLRIAGVVVFLAAYVASIVLYANSGASHPSEVIEKSPEAGGTTVTVDAEDMQSGNGLLVVNYTVSPGPELLDPATHTLKDDLSVLVTSGVSANKRSWAKGALPDVFRVSLPLTGEVANWPLDRYESGPITATLLFGAAQRPLTPNVIMVDRLLGWHIDAAHDNPADPFAPYRVQLRRSASTVAFGVLILGVLIALAGVALFVAMQTALDRRKFQPPMTTWYAAMLFAVMPLRNALPEAPPFGSWIDVTIVIWVVVVLVISMILYISCWWRHLRPEQPATPNPLTA